MEKIEILYDLVNVFLQIIFWIGSLRALILLIVFIIKTIYKLDEEKNNYSDNTFTILYWLSIYYMIQYIL